MISLLLFVTLISIIYFLGLKKRLPAPLLFGSTTKKIVLTVVLLIVLSLLATGKLNSLLAVFALMIIYFIKQVPNLVKFALHYKIQLSSFWSQYKKASQRANAQDSASQHSQTSATKNQGAHTQYSYKKTASPPSKNTLSLLEAYSVLGLKPGASQQDIITAHRKLMLKNHPDRGGSHHLAAKINLAKKLLLNNNQ